MLDGIVDVVSGCDIVSPTISFFRGLRNGPAVEFLVPVDVGWSAVQVRRMLEEKGVIVWGRQVAGEYITFKVRVTQARYAAYWLQRYRLPFDTTSNEDFTGSASATKAKATRSNGTSGKSANGKKAGLLDGVLDGIDGLVDKL